MGSGGGYLVEFSPGLEEEYTGYLEVLETEEEEQLLTGNTPINIGILSGLLALGLTTNLLAFPVILFKRTRFNYSCVVLFFRTAVNELVLSRFGNGQFAVLVLVLTMADLLTILVGLVGGLTLEVVEMSFLTKSVSKDFIKFFHLPRLATWPGQGTPWAASSTTSSPPGRVLIKINNSIKVEEIHIYNILEAARSCQLPCRRPPLPPSCQALHWIHIKVVLITQMLHLPLLHLYLHQYHHSM